MEEDNSVEGEKKILKSRSLVAEVTDRLTRLKAGEATGPEPGEVGEEVVHEGHIVEGGGGVKLSADNQLEVDAAMVNLTPRTELTPPEHSKMPSKPWENLNGMQRILISHSTNHQ